MEDRGACRRQTIDKPNILEDLHGAWLDALAARSTERLLALLDQGESDATPGKIESMP